MTVLKGLIIKLIMTTFILTIVFTLFFGFSLGTTLFLSLFFTLIAYLGDLFIMPRIGTTLATITDFPLAFLGLAILARLIFPIESTPWLPSFLAALLITSGEFFFHPYLLRKLKKRNLGRY